MTTRPHSDTILAEIGSVLSEFGGLLCAPELSTDDEGHVTLLLRVAPVGQETVGQALDTLELFNRLKRLIDFGQLRALAAAYDIDAGKLEALLPKEE